MIINVSRQSKAKVTMADDSILRAQNRKDLVSGGKDKILPGYCES